MKARTQTWLCLCADAHSEVPAKSRTHGHTGISRMIDHGWTRMDLRRVISRTLCHSSASTWHPGTQRLNRPCLDARPPLSDAGGRDEIPLQDRGSSRSHVRRIGRRFLHGWTLAYPQRFAGFQFRHSIASHAGWKCARGVPRARRGSARGSKGPRAFRAARGDAAARIAPALPRTFRRDLASRPGRNSCRARSREAAAAKRWFADVPGVSAEFKKHFLEK